MLRDQALVEPLFEPVYEFLFALLGHRLADGLAGLGSSADLGASIEDFEVYLFVLMLNSRTSNLVKDRNYRSVSLKKWLMTAFSNLLSGMWLPNCLDPGKIGLIELVGIKVCSRALAHKSQPDSLLQDTQ